MKTILILCGFLLSAACLWAQDGENVIIGVDAERFRYLMDSLEGEVVVDLRTPEELRQGKIQGAIEIDFFAQNFEPAIDALDKNKVYLVYCAGGGRSSETADLMRDRGFKKVYNLEEGFNGWKKKEMPATNDE